MLHEPISPLSSYEGLVYPEDEPPTEKIDNYLVFGDNFAGDSGMINLKTGKVAVHWHDSNEIFETNQSFREFIREAMEFDQPDES